MNVVVVLVGAQVVIGIVSTVVFLSDRAAGDDDSVATLLIGQAVSVGLPAVASVPLLGGRR